MMKFPTLHLNGTSAERLLEGWEAAYQSLNDAMAALAQCAPNGRDFYVQETGAFGRAVSEHEARMRRLQSVREELEQLVQNMVAQQTERNGRRSR